MKIKSSHVNTQKIQSDSELQFWALTNTVKALLQSPSWCHQLTASHLDALLQSCYMAAHGHSRSFEVSYWGKSVGYPRVKEPENSFAASKWAHCSAGDSRTWSLKGVWKFSPKVGRQQCSIDVLNTLLIIWWNILVTGILRPGPAEW